MEDIPSQRRNNELRDLERNKTYASGKKKKRKEKKGKNAKKKEWKGRKKAENWKKKKEIIKLMNNRYV